MIADYSAQWAQYKRLRNQAIIAVLSIFPLPLISRLTNALISNHSVAYALNLILGVTWMIAVYVTGARANFFPCPRCGKLFASKWWYRGSMLLARRCAHCGLPKYASSDGIPASTKS
jgi:hypothetical protein